MLKLNLMSKLVVKLVSIGLCLLMACQSHSSPAKMSHKSVSQANEGDNVAVKDTSLHSSYSGVRVKSVLSKGMLLLEDGRLAKRTPWGASITELKPKIVENGFAIIHDGDKQRLVGTYGQSYNIPHKEPILSIVTSWVGKEGCLEICGLDDRIGKRGNTNQLLCFSELSAGSIHQDAEISPNEALITWETGLSHYGFSCETKSLLLASGTMAEICFNSLDKRRGEVVECTHLKIQSQMPESGLLALVRGKDHFCKLSKDGQVGCVAFSSPMKAYRSDDVVQGEEITKLEGQQLLMALPSPAKNIYAGADSSCAWLENSELWCWGDTHRFEGPDGPLRPLSERLEATRDAYGDPIFNAENYWALPDAPMALPTNCEITDISYFDDQICAVCSDGCAQCWGQNRGGSLGYGDGALRWRPSNECLEIYEKKDEESVKQALQARHRAAQQEKKSSKELGNSRLSSASANPSSVSSSLAIQKLISKRWLLSDDGILYSRLSEANALNGKRAIKIGSEMLLVSTEEGERILSSMGELLPALPLNKPWLSAESKGYSARSESCVANESGELWCAFYRRIDGSDTYEEYFLADINYDNFKKSFYKEALRWVRIPKLSKDKILSFAGNANEGCYLEASGRRVSCWDRESWWDSNKKEKFHSYQLPQGILGKSISVGQNHLCVLSQDGRVGCWGRPAFLKQVKEVQSKKAANGQPYYRLEPPATLMKFPSKVERIFAGDEVSCAYLEDQSFYCWKETQSLKGEAAITASWILGSRLGFERDNFNLKQRFEQTVLIDPIDGRFGARIMPSGKRITYIPTTDFPAPQKMKMPDNCNIKDFAYFGDQVCVVCEDGCTQCWGNNFGGALGYGDDKERWEPTGECLKY